MAKSTEDKGEKKVEVKKTPTKTAWEERNAKIIVRGARTHNLKISTSKCHAVK
jgi:hypothetical protein